MSHLELNASLWAGNIVTIEHHRIVYIFDERVYGYLVVEGSYVSKVRYESMGIQYEVLMENDDFEVVEDIQIEIEEEE